VNLDRRRLKSEWLRSDLEVRLGFNELGSGSSIFFGGGRGGFVNGRWEAR
jgi:hypothetical protein